MIIFDIKNKESTVGLFMTNLLRGNVSMEYERFRRKQSSEQFAAQFHKRLKNFQMYDMCPNDDGSPPSTTDWLYDVIFEGRVYGAIKGEFKDETYEQRIHELESELEKRDKAISDLKLENQQLAEKLYEVTAKPPMSKEFKAMG